jgi:hypothetical protein
VAVGTGGVLVGGIAIVAATGLGAAFRLSVSDVGARVGKTAVSGLGITLQPTKTKTSRTPKITRFICFFASLC